MKKATLTTIFLAFTTLFATAQTDSTALYYAKGGDQTQTIIELKRKEAVTLSVKNDITSKELTIGKVVELMVEVNVEVDGHLLIPKGNYGEAIVRDVQRAKGFGRGGRIVLEVVRVVAFDGTSVPLKSTQLLVVEGRHRKGLAWGVSVAGVVVVSATCAATLGAAGIVAGVPCVALGSFIPGKDAEIKQGERLSAYVVETTPIGGRETGSLQYRTTKN
jgi:hypothetical protein